MAGVAGSILVEISANVARFQSDMGKVAMIAQRNAQQVEKAFDLVGTALKSMGAGFAIGLSIDKVKGQIEGVIKSAAGLQQLSERTGSTVESLSGLASVAKLSGTDTETLATGLQKLSKAMVDAQNGGAATGAAFKAVGIKASELKGLRPDEVFVRIAKAQDEYADGANKVAFAQALFGKSGANLLPVMKDLAAAGDLQTKVTADQAAMADEYEKNLVRLQAAQGAIYKRVAMELLPVMNAFVSAMLDSAKATNGVKGAVDGLADDGSIQSWAEGAAKSVAFVVDAFQGVVRTVQIVGKTIGAAIAQMLLLAKGELRAAVNVGQEWWRDVDAIAQQGFFSDRLNARLAEMRTNPTKAPDARRAMPLPVMETEQSKAGQAFLEQLQRQVKQQTENRFEMLRLEAAQKGVAVAAEKYIKDLETIYYRTEELKQLGERTARTEAERAKQGENQSAGMAIVTSLQQQTSALGLNAIAQRRLTELRKLDAMEVKALGEATAETFPEVLRQFATMRAKLIDALDELEDRERQLASSSAVGANRAFEAYALDAADAATHTENIIKGSLQRLEDALINFAKTGKLSFSDLFGFMAEEYLRALIKMSVADFLPNGKGLGGSSVLATGFSWLKGVLGFANGIPYVPYDNMPAILHEGERVLTKAEANGRNDGGNINIGAGQTINIGSNVSRAEVMAALKANQAQTIERIRRLDRQGRFA